MIKLVEFETLEGAAVALNPEHVVGVVGERSATQVELVTVTGVVYAVRQNPERPVVDYLTGGKPNKGWSAGQA